MAREAELPAIRKEEAECERLREAIGERNKTQAILRHEAAEDKAEIHRLKEELVCMLARKRVCVRAAVHVSHFWCTRNLALTL